jgi:hypothetical protein
VTLKAKTVINGVIYAETVSVSFGKGPLSVFAKPPSKGGWPWATASSIAVIDNKNDFTANWTTFAAAEFYGGTVQVGSSGITIGGVDRNRIRLILVTALGQVIGGMVISILISIIQLSLNFRLLAS